MVPDLFFIFLFFYFYFLWHIIEPLENLAKMKEPVKVSLKFPWNFLYEPNDRKEAIFWRNHCTAKSEQAPQKLKANQQNRVSHQFSFLWRSLAKCLNFLKSIQAKTHSLAVHKTATWRVLSCLSIPSNHIGLSALWVMFYL